MFRRRLSIWAATVMLVGMGVSREIAVGEDTNGGTDGGTDVNVGQQVAGIAVDASGVLKIKTVTDRGWVLTRRLITEARSALPRDVSRPSELRKISLSRLEAAVKACQDRGETPKEEMRYLAGLTRVRYVFFYPETKDIVFAGPAEGWMTDLTGRVRGLESGGPVIELQDLVVALRAFPPSGPESPLISCSIDPTQEGLARLQAFLRSLGSRAVPGQTQFIVNGLRESLGLQDIKIRGVPANTHFAQVLVEADYRMKLIGIGLEQPPRVGVVSYVSLAKRNSTPANAMQRWYFVPNYDCVRVTEDKLAMEMIGDGVKLIGADELVTSEGMRVKSNQVDQAGKRFVEGFTANYAPLARALPVYAQLRNLIDLSVAAAFVKQQDYYGKAGWTIGLFGDESKFPVQTAVAPQRVESAVTSVWSGNRLTTPIGGGVRIEAKNAFTAENLLPDDQGKVREQREKISLDQLAEGQWWWD